MTDLRLVWIADLLNILKLKTDLDRPQQARGGWQEVACLRLKVPHNNLNQSSLRWIQRSRSS